MTKIFDLFKHDFRKIHEDFLNTMFIELDENLRNAYQNYTVLDENYPRPLLTLLGVNYSSLEAPKIDSCKDSLFLLIPQLLRDFLAIHDDIIDEDIEKFHQDTLPFAYGKIFEESIEQMNKEGKDLALLFGDYLFPKIYEIAINTNIPEERKIKIINCINKVLTNTNIGQIDELIMQHIDIRKYTAEEILQMYQLKAADYCYAFPFELGLLYADAPDDLISEVRTILLRIGAASQVVDDLMGIFPEAMGETKFTLSDLMYLRRSYILLLLSQNCRDDNIINGILNQNGCTKEQALILKEKMCQLGILRKVVDTICNECEYIESKIDKLKIGEYCKRYFHELVNSRVKDNLNKIVLYYNL